MSDDFGTCLLCQLHKRLRPVSQLCTFCYVWNITAQERELEHKNKLSLSPERIKEIQANLQTP